MTEASYEIILANKVKTSHFVPPDERIKFYLSLARVIKSPIQQLA